VAVENPRGLWAVESEVVAAKIGHCPRRLGETEVDTTETTIVHALLALAAADKMLVKDFEQQVARAQIDLVSWMSSSTPQSAQEREVQAKHDQHGRAVSRESW
jgi:hypothetical protein